MLEKVFRAVLLGCGLAMLAGCATSRSISLLLDMEYDKSFPVPPAPELVLHKEDRLGIQVLSETPELASPFNSGLSLADTQASAQKIVSYVVDEGGCINFPVLGVLHVEGMTLREVQDLLVRLISEKGYIREPVVNVRLENFRVNLLGALGNNEFAVKEPSINLLQLLSRSGAVSQNSNIRDVMVIRTEGNQKKAYHVDLQKKDLFNSPVFFLQQNDVVYVKPKGSPLSPEGQAIVSFTGVGLTLASIISNFLIWYKR